MSQILANELISAIPYDRTLGIEVKVVDDSLTLILPYQQSNIGNPTLPALLGAN